MEVERTLCPTSLGVARLTVGGFPGQRADRYCSAAAVVMTVTHTRDGTLDRAGSNRSQGGLDVVTVRVALHMLEAVESVGQYSLHFVNRYEYPPVDLDVKKIP